MSSVLRVFKFRSYFNSTAKLFFKNASHLERSLYLHNFKLPIQLGPVKISERSYGFQHFQPQPKDDFLNSPTADLESDFKFLDSILGRASFLNKKTLQNVITKTSHAQEITSSQAVFLLSCCRSSAILENKATRRKLVSQVWKIYQDKGISLDISHYNAFLQVLVETEADFSPLDFLATLEEKNIKPNRITYSRLIAKFCQKGDIDGANKILEHMKNNGIEINEYVFSSLILGNSRANDLDGALAVVDIMKQSKITLGPDTYASLIQAYGEHNKFDEIDSLLSDIKKELLSQNAFLEIVGILVNLSAAASVIDKVINFMDNKESLSFSLLKQTSCFLIFSGHEELAYKLYKKIPRTESQNHIGGYFPKLLATSNKDLHIVVKYCDDIRNNGWNILSYENALESYLQDFNFDSAMALIRVMKERGISLKEHYFYPVLVNAGKEHNLDKVFEFFEEMISLEVPLSSEFFSEFLLPSLKVTNDLDHIQSLYMRFYSFRNETNFQYIYHGFVEYLMKRFDLELVAKFVSQNRRGIMASVSPLLADFYVNHLNAEATAVILHQMLPLDVRMRRDFEVEEIENRYGGIRNFLRITISGLRKMNLFDSRMPALLKAMENEGIYLVPTIIEDLTSEFGESINPDVQETLTKLSDNSLVPSSSYSQETNVTYNPVRTSLRQRIAESESDGQFDESLNLQHLINSIRRENLQEVEEVLQKLKLNKVEVPPPVYLMILSMYVDEKLYERAEVELNNFLEMYPDVQISSVKIIKFVKMFTDIGRFEDAIKCILINSPENGMWPENMQPNMELQYYRSTISYILKQVAENSDISTLKRMQEALLSKNFAPTQLVMPSLVVHHLHQNNIEEALSCFKKIAEEHKVTAGKYELTVACIEEEDTDKLQEILDISNQIHGDINTLYDLVFAFIDVGKYVQAERVLQTSGMRTREDKINHKCEYYVRGGKIESLKGLINITKNLFNINRQKLFSYLLEAYIQANDTDNSLGVWTQMQEENVSPDNQFLIRLGNYLKSNGCDVPFVIPQTSVSKTGNNITDELQEAVKRNKFLEMEQLLSNLNQWQDVPSNLMDQVIEKFFYHGKTKELARVAKEMFAKGLKIQKGYVNRLLTILRDDADVETIESFDKYLDRSYKAACFYHSHLSTAMVNAGRGKELLETNLKLLQENSDIDFNDFTITRRSIFKILEKHPEMHKDVVNLIEIMKNHGNDRIQNSGKSFMDDLFQHYYLSGNVEESDKIYNEHLQDKNDFTIKNITSNCFRNKDTDKLDKLLEVINRKPEGREGMKGFIYSCYIDILVEKGMLEEGVNIIKKSLEIGVSLENYNLKSLFQLKRRMNNEDLTFPFEIPVSRKEENISSSSSSSSSSDDEK